MYDVVIVGAGVVGCAIARELSKYALSLAVVEAKADVGTGASKANSAIVHAGYDCHVGSNMARVNVRGNAMFDQMCRELNIPLKRIGSLVLAFSKEEQAALEELLENGIKNGVPGLRIIDAAEAAQMQPGLSDALCAALYAPTGAITNPYELTVALHDSARKNGATFFFNHELCKIDQQENGAALHFTNGQTIDAGFIVNAAGIYSDRVSKMAGDDSFTIHPRKGEYILFDRAVSDFAKMVLFQAPTALGKGVLVAPTVDGNSYIGPTAVEQESREDTSVRREAIDELKLAAGKSVPNLPLHRPITLFAGLRAVPKPYDFVLGQSKYNPRLVQAAGICSPGLSSAPAIAEETVQALGAAGLALREKPDYDPNLEKHTFFREMTTEEKAEAVRRDPAYGRIVCRCETVPEAEILRAIRSIDGVPTLDGIKRRARAGMGRCQGGFCTSRILELIAKEKGVPMESITKSGGESALLVGQTRKEGGAQ